jgi:tol-pal system protein YbgF
MAIPSRMVRVAATGLLLVAAAPALGQSAAPGSRLSLAERVQRLEQQVQGGVPHSTRELLQRIEDLENELRALRGLIEQQTFELEALRRRQRDQYVDLDARLARLEGVPPATGSAPMAPVEDPAAPSGGLRAGPIEVAPPPLPAGGSAQEEMPPAQGGSAPTPAPPSPWPDERTAYEQAFQALRDGRYAESARRFQEFLRLYPDGAFADNAKYWLGESYYVTQNYRVALETFQALLREHPNSAKAPDAMLKIGYCHYELREWDQAERVLSEVVRLYPDTPVARLAQGRLRALRLETRR